MPCGMLQANCTVLYDTITKKGVIFDTGGEIDKILGAVKERDLTIEKIIYTHGPSPLIPIMRNSAFHTQLTLIISMQQVLKGQTLL